MPRCLAMTLLILSAAIACFPQSADTTGGSRTSAQPAAQAGSNTSTTSAAPGTSLAPGAQNGATAGKKKPKKVWTNDEIGSVKGDISVVGSGKSESASRDSASESGGAEDVHAELVQNYRNQIQQLRDQIRAADSRIEQLKGFKGENTSPSAGINMNRGYTMVPVEEQLKQLEEKKKKLERRIEDLEVAAKKNAIDPGELR